MATKSLSDALSAQTTSTNTREKPYFGSDFSKEDAEIIVQAYNKATNNNLTLQSCNRSAIAKYIFAKFAQEQGLL